jgi:hypothetical protein
MPAVVWNVILPSESKYMSMVKSPSEIRLLESEVTNSPKDFRDDIDHEEFDENSRWPRRLLNVRNMTSYKWQPGNMYGGTSNPSFSTLSYTWGRWRIRDKHSLIPALQVVGIPWEVPKVNPQHFTAKQFGQVLKHIVNIEGSEGSPFVWVDIACIPQFLHSRVADSEIGRQAKIFRAARTGYVWLTTANPQDLAKLFEEDPRHESREAVRDLKAFCKLLTDPWFGSMWTLQESFIKQAAYVVTNSGLCNLSRTGKPLHLFQVRGLAVHYDGSAAYKVIHDRSKGEEDFTFFEDMWSRTGLQGPLSASPMQVLACATWRTCSFELDRVYGIMQIFGDDFRVGKARSKRVALEDAETKESFTLLELEDELSTLVIERFPSISQLFQHEQTPILGRAWRICGRASVPRQLGYASGSFNDALWSLSMSTFDNPASVYHLLPQPQCSFSTIANGTTKLGLFQGKTCTFQRIVNCSRSVSFTPVWSSLQVYLDAGWDITSHNERSDKCTVSEADVDLVVERLGGQALIVLLLDSRTDLEVGKTFCLNGLLLLRPGSEARRHHKSRRDWYPEFEHLGKETWARVGICQLEWYEERRGDSYMSGPEIETLLGISNDWCESEGVWG